MTIRAIASGVVVGQPVALTTDSDSAAVLLLRDGCSCDLPVEYEVFCRDPRLAELVLQRVGVGDALLAVGTLRLHRVLGPVEDQASAARVVLDATNVARDLRCEEDSAATLTGLAGS